MGDIEIDELFHKYVDDIYNYLVYFTNSLDVEDLVQETFIKAIKGIDNFKGVSQPRTWLLKIARNVAIDHHRRKNNVKFLSIDLLDKFPVNQVTPERIAEINETHETILALIHQLKKDYRDVVLHRVIIGLSTSETADTLGWAESKVKTTLHRALKHLRKSLEETQKGGLMYDYI